MATPSNAANLPTPGGGGSISESPSDSKVSLRIVGGREQDNYSQSVQANVLISDWDSQFTGFLKPNIPSAVTITSQSAENPAYFAVVRRRAIEEIRHFLVNLNQHAGDPDIAVYTYPITRGLNDLIAKLSDAGSEGNTREILRRMRNTILDGGWKRYRNSDARKCLAEALEFLGTVEKVLPGDIQRLTQSMEVAGLQPFGAPLFNYEFGATTIDGQEEQAKGNETSSNSEIKPDEIPD